jgi:hypothetical protein
MHAFKAEIGGDQQLKARFEAKDGAIVANAHFHCTVRRRGRHSPNLVNQASFAGHGILQLYQNQRLRMIQAQSAGGSNADALGTESPNEICIELKDMAPTRFILAQGSRPSLPHQALS